MKSYVCTPLTYLTLISTIVLTFVSSQATVQTECAKVGATARSYEDCKAYDNEEAFTLCCFVQGTSNNTDEASCLDVDILFKDRVIEYTNGGVSGKLICKADGVNPSSFLQTKLSSLLLSILFFIL